jgi:hypothetical protein
VRKRQWWGLKHRIDGSETAVSDLSGISEERWIITPLDREPKPDEVFKDGRLQACPEAAALIARSADPLEGMSRAELVDHILGLVDARLEAKAKKGVAG